MRLGLVCASTFCRFLWLGGCFLTFLCFLIYFLLLAGFFLNFESIFHHCSLFFFALFVVFWHLEQLFVLEINFFVKWIQKRKKKCKKMQKRASKLADLVCTKEFFLYKSSQISNKCESDFLVCYLFLLATVWTHDKRGQMPPNNTKRKWLLLKALLWRQSNHPLALSGRSSLHHSCQLDAHLTSQRWLREQSSNHVKLGFHVGLNRLCGCFQTVWAGLKLWGLCSRGLGSFMNFPYSQWCWHRDG